MAVITEQTPSQVQASVRAYRQQFEKEEVERPLPFDDRSGGFQAAKHTVTAAEDTAGTLDIVTEFGTVDSFRFSVYTAAGQKKNADQYVVTISGGTVTVADGGVDQVTATDIIHWEARGK